jgi:anthranilate synthase/phosphoribosyltransferase
MIVVIDNYDSFTYNLVQYLGELGAEPWVFRNDQINVAELASMRPSHIIISPGPGSPDKDAGVSNRIIRHFHGNTPILGVCLGHQCIGHAFGGHVSRAPRLMHGKTSPIIHQGGRLFAGLPSPFEATRYHSLIVQDPLPESLQAIARTPEGEIMAMRHRHAPTFGVQFHPESVLTGHGKRLLKNFLSMDCEHHLDADAEGATSPAEITLPEAIERALLAEHLSVDEAEAVMLRIMGGEATPAQIGGYLAALRAKGETTAEITGFARAMRRFATAVRPSRRPLIDTCGTGGDRAGTFNVSTTAALVVAAAGVAVAKHGNRSVSSKSGSADVLQALGVKLDLPPEVMARCIDEVGFGFLFAPMLHPAMKHAIGPRREMGVRTVFNILGPLTNPAGATMQIVGVFDRALIEPLANVLHDLGVEGAYVVNSADGLDELSVTGRNYVACLRDGHVSRFELDPGDYGLSIAPLASVRGGDATENACITRDILAGERGARRDMVLLNAGAALVAANVATDLHEGIRRAADAIDSGRATQVLDNLIAFTQGVPVP